MEAACTGTNDQWTTSADCLAFCAVIPAGTAGATSGDSAACRTYHAGVAASDAATHCPHAGPLGAGACGTACDAYCDVMVANCTGAFADKPACVTACTTAALTAGDPTDTTGDSMSCRIYHANAARTNATTHCPHASLTATAPCTGTP